MLTVVDEFSRECLAIEVERSLKANDVLEVLARLFAEHGSPTHIRSDNSPEFTAIAMRSWLEKLGVKTLFIHPGSPRENGYNERFNGTLREEVLNREIFFTLTEAKILIEQWRRNTTPSGFTAHWDTDRQHRRQPDRIERSWIGQLSADLSHSKER